jgi:hypothetical protein
LATIEEITNFLKEFKQRLVQKGKFDFIEWRSINRDTLTYLGITPHHVKQVIAGLTYENYCFGPEKDRDRPKGDLWCFGVSYSGEEIYIKLSDNFSYDRAKCISFHVACEKLSYPYRGK